MPDLTPQERTKFAGKLATIRENAEFVRAHQWAIECNSQMEDMLATIARALLECADLFEDTLDD